MENQAVWAVVGGAPRTWILSPGTQPRDIDIVVNTSPQALEAIIKHLADAASDGVSIGRTSLGGYRLALANLKVDVWPLRQTYGIATGLVSDSNAFRGVASAAAISIDSLVVTSKSAVYDRGFFDTIASGELRLIRDGPIVNAERIARKSAALCSRHKLVPDIPLKALINTYLKREPGVAAYDPASSFSWGATPHQLPLPFCSRSGGCT